MVQGRRHGDCSRSVDAELAGGVTRGDAVGQGILVGVGGGDAAHGSSNGGVLSDGEAVVVLVERRRLVHVGHVYVDGRSALLAPGVSGFHSEGVGSGLFPVQLARHGDDATCRYGELAVVVARGDAVGELVRVRMGGGDGPNLVAGFGVFRH